MFASNSRIEIGQAWIKGSKEGSMQVERSTKSQRIDYGQARARAQGARAHIAESARDAHAYRARTRRCLHMASLRQHVPGDFEGFLNPFWRQLLIERNKRIKA